MKRIVLMLLAYHGALLLVEVFEDAIMTLAMRVGEIVEGARMNEVQREMLKNAGLLREFADELVTAIEVGDYRSVSLGATITGRMLYELSRLALAADMQREAGE